MEKFAQSVINAARRQEAEAYYRLNGAIYIVDVNVVFSKKSLYEDACFAYIMEEKIPLILMQWTILNMQNFL